jgi:hypothetical protein
MSPRFGALFAKRHAETASCSEATRHPAKQTQLSTPQTIVPVGTRISPRGNPPSEAFTTPLSDARLPRCAKEFGPDQVFSSDNGGIASGMVHLSSGTAGKSQSRARRRDSATEPQSPSSSVSWISHRTYFIVALFLVHVSSDRLNLSEGGFGRTVDLELFWLDRTRGPITHRLRHPDQAESCEYGRQLLSRARLAR